MDGQTIAIVGALIINAIATGWNIYKTTLVHKQTEELQDANAKLQSEVHRLSVHLNQEISRLERLNELARGMYLSYARINHKYGLMKSVGVKSILDNKMANVSIDEFADFLITVKGSIMEMRAIANVIGDSELQSLVEQMQNSIPVGIAEEPEQSRKYVAKLEESATELLEKVYRLLQSATEAA